LLSESKQEPEIGLERDRKFKGIDVNEESNDQDFFLTTGRGIQKSVTERRNKKSYWEETKDETKSTIIDNRNYPSPKPIKNLKDKASSHIYVSMGDISASPMKEKRRKIRNFRYYLPKPLDISTVNKKMNIRFELGLGLGSRYSKSFNMSIG
jgi:hypothetical protein